MYTFIWKRGIRCNLNNLLSVIFRNRWLPQRVQCLSITEDDGSKNGLVLCFNYLCHSGTWNFTSTRFSRYLISGFRIIGAFSWGNLFYGNFYHSTTESRPVIVLLTIPQNKDFRSFFTVAFKYAFPKQCSYFLDEISYLPKYWTEIVIWKGNHCIAPISRACPEWDSNPLLRVFLARKHGC